MHFVRRHFSVALIFVLTIIALAMMVPIVMRTLVDRYITTTVDSVPRTEVALVLGASVYRGKPSPRLAERADVAVALYRANKVSKILVTGDNGTLSYDEVTPVRKYLLGAGIPSQDIFLDHAGSDTYSTMYPPRGVLLARSLPIVTQDFHLPRARKTWRSRYILL